MKYEQKRYLLMILSLSAIVIIIAIIKATSLIEATKIIIYPTLVFIPFAFLFYKLGLYKTSDFSNKYSSLLAVIGIAIGAVIAPIISINAKLFFIVIGFETVCLYCAILMMTDRGNNKKKDQ